MQQARLQKYDFSAVANMLSLLFAGKPRQLKFIHTNRRLHSRNFYFSAGQAGGSAKYSYICRPTVPVGLFSTQNPIFFMKQFVSVFLLTLLLHTLGSLPLSAQDTPQAPRREMRAVWLTTLGGLDWPAIKVRQPSDTLRQQQELCGILDRLQQAGFNTVFLQTRIRATTLYPSRYEPWDGALTGTPGHAPGYDPLAFALRECHRRGMELHAWVVAFPLGKQAALKKLGSRAVSRRHPSLCRQAGPDVYLDPGVPGVAPYLGSLCAEIARRYDVDGIHLDYIRYPEAAIPFNDAATYRRYGHRQKRADWRRANVDRVVRTISDSVRRARPWVRLSCSPVGKYADLPQISSYGWNARDAVSQDAVKWVRQGWMDFIVPMLYFRGRHFYPFAADWVNRLSGPQVVPGLAAYMLDPSIQDWALDSLRAEMQFTRLQEAGGQAYFRARFVLDNTKGLYDLLKDEFYTRPALTPCLRTDSSGRPSRPALHASRDSSHIRIAWAPDSTTAGGLTYQIYALPQPADTGRTMRLLRTHLRDTVYVIQTPTPQLRQTTFAVTATDRWGRESSLALIEPPQICKPLPPRTYRLVLPHKRRARLLVVKDEAGREVLYRTYQTEVDLSELPAGRYRLYYVRGRLLRRLHHLQNLEIK